MTSGGRICITPLIMVQTSCSACKEGKTLLSLFPLFSQNGEISCHITWNTNSTLIVHTHVQSYPTGTLKSGLKYSTYSVVMHSLCTQDTILPCCPWYHLVLWPQNTFECQNETTTHKTTTSKSRGTLVSTSCLTKSHKVSFKIWSLISTVHF